MSLGSKVRLKYSRGLNESCYTNLAFLYVCSNNIKGYRILIYHVVLLYITSVVTRSFYPINKTTLLKLVNNVIIMMLQCYLAYLRVNIDIHKKCLCTTM
jgi:hypothetical protein